MDEFKVGDLVRLTERGLRYADNVSRGSMGIIRRNSRGGTSWGVEWLDSEVRGHDLDGFIETETGYYVEPEYLEKVDKIINWRELVCGNQKQ